MIKSIVNSYKVLLESFRILCRDKMMLVFPLFSGAACLLAILTFIVPVFLAAWELWPLSLFLIFACYLALYFICIFFSSAMVAYASMRIKDNKPTISGALGIAGKSAGNIFLWSLFSATLGALLEFIDMITKNKLDFLTSIFGMVWSLATFFALPVIIFENKTPFAALRSSAELFKKRWGEAVSGIVGIGLSMILLGILGLLALVGLVYILPDIAALSAFVIFALYALLLMVLYAALNSIYVAALYHFAITGEMKGNFPIEVYRTRA